jgi:hypothetical protein
VIAHIGKLSAADLLRCHQTLEIKVAPGRAAGKTAHGYLRVRIFMIIL